MQVEIKTWPKPRPYQMIEHEIPLDDEFIMIKNTIDVLKLRYDESYKNYLDALEYKDYLDIEKAKENDGKNNDENLREVEIFLTNLRKQLMQNTVDRADLLEYYKNKINKNI